MVDFLFVNATQTMQFCFNKTTEMIKNFTIVNEDKQLKKASVTLTGYVASFNSENSFNSAKFIEIFNGLKADFNHIHIDIVNLYGGSIMEGIPVFNHIKETAEEGSVKITGKIEGLAASMGSIIAMAIPVENLEMGNMARLMNHKAKGGAYGTADEVRNTAEMIQGYEDDMVAILAERTGLSTDDIITKWMNGVDNYIKAEDAKKLKLVGKISASNIKSKIPKNFASPEDAFNFYNTNLKFNLNTNMELEKQLRETLKLGADDSIIDAILKLQSDAAVKPKYDALLQQNINNQAKEVQALMTKLKDGKLITEEQVPTYEALFKADFDNAKKVVEAMLSKPAQNVNLETFIDGLPAGGKKPEAVTKDYHWYELNDPKALLEMKANEPEKFEQLFNEYYK
jgi:ATP-dependent protease ClpP protease subunit